MKRISFLLLLVIVVAFSSSAKDKIDFSGEWSFNKTQSEYGPGGDRFVPIKLYIMHTDTLIAVERTYQREYKNDFIDSSSFTLDGAENHSTFWRSPRIITAQWAEDEQLLTIRTKITFTQDGQESEVFSIDIWRLIENGSQLSRDFTIDGPQGKMKAIYVFSRME